jgi:hypothetical protein
MFVCPSVCLSAWNNSAPTGQILMQFDTWIFSKICWANESLIKIRQKLWVLYMMTFSHLWQYRAKSFLAWEMFQIKVVEKIKTHFLCSITFCPLWYNVKSFTAATESTATMASCRRLTLALSLLLSSKSVHTGAGPHSAGSLLRKGREVDHWPPIYFRSKEFVELLLHFFLCLDVVHTDYFAIL